MMLPSDRFKSITGKSHLYNIMPIENIPSVLQYGILCHEEAERIVHDSVALEDVQAKRESVIVLGGMPLHRYANLYFDMHNPMLYKRKNQAEELCILVLSATVLDIEGCVVTDRNAAARIARFLSPDIGLERIDFNLVYAKYWNNGSETERINHKAIKCAEVLIPERIDSSFIESAIVVDTFVKDMLVKKGFQRPIKADPQVFYR